MKRWLAWTVAPGWCRSMAPVLRRKGQPNEAALADRRAPHHRPWPAPVPSRAQVLGTGILPVTEVGAQLIQSTVTATQSVITAIEAVIQTANMFLELTPVDEIIVGGQIAEDLALLAEVWSVPNWSGTTCKAWRAKSRRCLGWTLRPIRGPAWTSGCWRSNSSTIAR